MMTNALIILRIPTVLVSTLIPLLFLIATNIGYFFFGSSQLLKKLLILEIIRILIILISSHLIAFKILRLDLLIILLVFLVIDAVLGLRLAVSLRRKANANLKINKTFWLCS
jgi:hypothetical protein